MLPRLSNTPGTKIRLDSQKVWIIKADIHEIDKYSYKKSSETVNLLISYSQVISLLLEDPCYYKYFDCSI